MQTTDSGLVNQKGHVYLWVILLIFTISLNSVVVISLQHMHARRIQERQLLAIGEEFRQALMSYKHSSQNPIDAIGPAQLNDLVKDNKQVRVLRHIRRIYADPMTGKDEWGVKRQAGRIVGVYSLSTAKPLKIDGFAPRWIHFENAASYRDWIFEASL